MVEATHAERAALVAFGRYAAIAARFPGERHGTKDAVYKFYNDKIDFEGGRSLVNATLISKGKFGEVPQDIRERLESILRVLEVEQKGLNPNSGNALSQARAATIAAILTAVEEPSLVRKAAASMQSTQRAAIQPDEPTTPPERCAPRSEGHAASINWDLNWRDFYRLEIDRCVVDAQSGIVLPQVRAQGTDQWRDLGAVHIAIGSDFDAPYKVKASLDLYQSAARRERKRLYPGEVARVERISADEIAFSKVSYFDYLATNLSLDFPIGHGTTLRTSVHGGGKLDDLDSSRLANTLGVNGLAFSRDGHLILQRRSPDLIERPNELCSSFSGSVDFSDVSRMDGKPLSEVCWTRELTEETLDSRVPLHNLTFVGLTRELIRGGKPEIFFCLDAGLFSDEVADCFPEKAEGEIVLVDLGLLGHCSALPAPEIAFGDLTRMISASLDAPLSLALETNLLLWYAGETRVRCDRA